MRLREIKFILDSTDFGEAYLRVGERTSSGYYLINIINFKSFLDIIDKLVFFKEEVNILQQSEIFSTGQDTLFLLDKKADKIRNNANYLVQATESLSRVLSIMLVEQSENSIQIKLPRPSDFLSLIKFLSEFEKSINQVISNDKIGGQLQIKSWESGSFWIELLLGSQAAVSLIAGIAWAGAVISKKIKEGKILEQQVKSLEIKNESLNDILEKQKSMTDLLLEKEVRHLQIQHFESDQDKEQFERLKMATKTFAELIQKGAEVHPALTAPEQVKNVFPNYKIIDTIASQIKLLEDAGPESKQD